MYINVIKRSFSSAHKIDGHKGKCAHLHGHNWTVEVAVKGFELDDIGIAIDFSDMKAIVDPVIEDLDHCYLNEKPYFQKHPPTAENVARYIYKIIEEPFCKENIEIEEVVIWETDGCGVRYRGQD